MRVTHTTVVPSEGRDLLGDPGGGDSAGQFSSLYLMQ